MTTRSFDDLDEPSTVAKHLNVSIRTVQRLAQTGKIPSYRVGDQFRFDLAEVRASLRAKRSA